MISNNNASNLVALLLLCSVSSARSFQATRTLPFSRRAITLKEAEASEEAKSSALGRVKDVFRDAPKEEITPYVGNIQKIFPGALSNLELEFKVVSVLSGKGFTPENTLLATSLCCDELARRLEDDLINVYGNNFSLGGLSGFPFAGNTGFGAMAAHIPDDGSCLIVYGPHVGVSKSGQVGKVERVGIELVDNCCGSAIAASNYLRGISDGSVPITSQIQEFTDFQQGAVQELILPHFRRLSEAPDRMMELPYAFFDSQDVMMQDIVRAGAAGGKKNGFALLGGLQINTAPDTLDYFLPLRFDLVNTEGEIVESLLDSLVVPDLQGMGGGGGRSEAAAPLVMSSSAPEEKSGGGGTRTGQAFKDSRKVVSRPDTGDEWQQYDERQQYDDDEWQYDPRQLDEEYKDFKANILFSDFLDSRGPIDSDPL